MKLRTSLDRSRHIAAGVAKRLLRIERLNEEALFDMTHVELLP